MNGVRRVRVGFLNTHPIQYFAPFYRFINTSPDVTAVPIYLTNTSLRGSVDSQFGQKVVWDTDLIAGTEPIFVPGFDTRSIKPGFLRNWVPQIWRTVRHAKLDALLVHGYSHGANWIAYAAGRSVGIPILHRGDSQLAVDRAIWRRSLKRTFLPLILKRFDAFLAAGTRNREYYRHYGVPEERIIIAPLAVDNDSFILPPHDLKTLAETRLSLGLRDGVPAIVTVGKLTRQKRNHDVIEAVDRLRAEGIDCDLLIVGTGAEESDLRALGQSMHGPQPVFAGFVNQSDLPRLLACTDIFAMAADNESWGLAINEAMCAALPIIAANRIGAVSDLVHDGKNGATYNPGNVAELVAALRPLLVDQAKRTKAGLESRRIIQHWSYSETLAGLRSALQFVQC